MNKELTPLEALENIKHIDCYEDDGGHYVGYAKDVYPKDFDIIESAFKRLDLYDNLVGIVAIQDTNKKLKALEIIKDLFEVWEDNGTYHLRPLYDIMKLTKEEYDLLKEVLL